MIFSTNREEPFFVIIFSEQLKVSSLSISLFSRDYLNLTQILKKSDSSLHQQQTSNTY